MGSEWRLEGRLNGVSDFFVCIISQQINMFLSVYRRVCFQEILLFFFLAGLIFFFEFWWGKLDLELAVLKYIVGVFCSHA